MALIQETIIDNITILETGHLQVRAATYIIDTAIVVAPSMSNRIAGPKYHRHVLSPGDDTSQEATKVQEHANVAWTPEIIAAEEARKEAERIKNQ